MSTTDWKTEAWPPNPDNPFVRIATSPPGTKLNKTTRKALGRYFSRWEQVLSRSRRRLHKQVARLGPLSLDELEVALAKAGAALPDHEGVPRWG
jgi:hypothetical protein